MFGAFRYLIDIIALGSYYVRCISQFLRIVKSFFAFISSPSFHITQMHQRNYARKLFFLFTSLFSHHHLTLRKHGGHSSLLCFNDIHSRQVGSNRPVDLPGNVIVRARSTLPLLNSSL